MKIDFFLNICLRYIRLLLNTIWMNVAYTNVQCIINVGLFRAQESIGIIQPEKTFFEDEYIYNEDPNGFSSHDQMQDYNLDEVGSQDTVFEDIVMQRVFERQQSNSFDYCGGDIDKWLQEKLVSVMRYESGGYGTVFQLVLESGKMLAVKIFNKKIFGDYQTNFIEEARNLPTLRSSCYLASFLACHYGKGRTFEDYVCVQGCQRTKISFETQQEYDQQKARDANFKILLKQVIEKLDDLDVTDRFPAIVMEWRHGDLHNTWFNPVCKIRSRYTHLSMRETITVLNQSKHFSF